MSSRGGKSRVGDGEFAFEDLDGVGEGQPIRLDVIDYGSLVHELPCAEVGEQEAEELLLDQFGGFAAQDHTSAAQVCLELVVSDLDFPA